VSSFVAEAGTTGAIPRAAGRLGVVELDEAVWPRLLPRLRPRVAVFLNLFRDQLDRYGEVDSIAEGWQRALATHAPLDAPLTLVLNVDDPSVAALADAHRGEVFGFGVEDPSVALGAAEHASDARFCACGATYRYDAVYMGHVGAWRCPGCGRARPVPQVAARHIRLGADTTRFELSVAGATAEVTLPLAGLYSVYNALAAAAGAHALGLPFEATVRALAESGPAFGRQERFDLDGRSVRLLLAKNPTGLNEVIRALRAVPGAPTLLALLNDGIQDGQDVSWIYDADFERLADRSWRLVVSGDRADDLALRARRARAANGGRRPCARARCCARSDAAGRPHRGDRDVHRDARDPCAAGCAHRRAPVLGRDRRGGAAMTSADRAIRVVVLYPEVMDVYADRGNLLAVQARCRALGVGCEVIEVGLGDALPDAADMVLIGGGQDREQRRIASDLAAKGVELRAWAEADTPMLAASSSSGRSTAPALARSCRALGCST
jgi:hypothetical protein